MRLLLLDIREALLRFGWVPYASFQQGCREAGLPGGPVPYLACMVSAMWRSLTGGGRGEEV